MIEYSCLEYDAEMTHKQDEYSSDEDFDSNETHRKNNNQNGLEHTETDAKQRMSQKAEKTFEELVEESIRLPEISPSSHLPMTMTEILRSSQKETNAASTNLPQIHRGQVQLVSSSEDGKASERKRRLREKKAKLSRPRRPSPSQQPSSSEQSDASNNVNNVNTASSRLRDGKKGKEQTNWKKKLHRRQNKRRMAKDTDPALSVSGEFRLPALQGVPKIKQTCIER